MEHKYIFLKDSDGYENLWEIIHETNGVYVINRCNDMSIILKTDCYSKNGNILYSSAVRNFEPVSYEENDESYLKYISYWSDCEEYPDSKRQIYHFDDDDILSIEYLKELEYNFYDSKYQKWINEDNV